jgi:TP901 family phage tail tape measure protein
MKVSTGGSNFNINVGVIPQTSQARQQLDTFIKQAEKTSDIKLNIKFNSQGRQVIRQVKTETGDLVTVTKQYNRQGQVLSTTVNKISRDYRNLANTTQQVTTAQQNLNNTASRSVNIFNDFTATFMKMVKFNTINLIYDKIIQSMTKTIEVTEKFNAATTEFKKVSDLSGKSLNEYTQQLGKLGQEVSRTTSEMVEGATSFKKSGFTDEESAQLAKLAAQFQNIADEELEASEAANILISVMKGFRLSTQDVEHIEDSINSVSNAFAVSSADISQGLGNVAAVSHTAGNSLEETIGMLTAMVEISRSASKSSRGLVQITTRLSQTLDDSSSTGKKLRAIYEDLGIALEDERGQLRSSYDILKDLSQVWGGLSENQQKYIALTSSGANQINNFTALMSNFDTAIKATETALNSAGSAAQENAKYMESIKAQVTELQAQLERLILGDGGFEKFVTSTLKLANGIISLINALGGLQSIFVVIGTVGIIAIIQNFEKFLKLSKDLGGSLIKPFKTLATYISTTFNTYVETSIDSMFGLATAEEVAAASTAMLQLALSAVVAVIGIAIIAYQNYKRAQEEAQQNAVNAARNYKTEQESLKNVIAQLNDESKTRSQLASIIKQQLGDAYDSEIDNLQNVNDLRKKGIELLYAEARAKAEDIQRTTGAQYTQAKEDLSKEQTVIIGAGAETRQYDGTDEARYEAIGKQIDAYNEKIRQNIKLSYDEQWTLEALEKEYEKLGEEIKQNKDIVNSYDEATTLLEGDLDSYMESLVETAKETEDYQEVLDKFGYETLEDLEKALIKAGGSEEDFNEALLAGKDALDEYADSLLNAENNAGEFNDAIAEQVDSLKSVQSAYDTLKAAVDEYNSKGHLTADTISKLNQLTADQIAAMTIENGVASLNVQLLQQQFEVEKQELIIKLEMAKRTAEIALAQEYLNKATQGANTTVQQGGETAQNAATGYADLAQMAYAAYQAMEAVRTGTDAGTYEEFQARLAELDKQFDDMIADVENSSLDMSTTASKAAGAHKDAWVEAFEKEKDALKNLLETDQITEYEYYQRLAELNEKYFGEISGNHEKYIKEYNENEEEIYKGMKEVYGKVRDYLKEAVEQGYEKAINALKKEEKEVLAEIKKQIEAIKKEKEEVIKGIEKQIKALKKEKEAIEKYYNDQIDAIKRENEALQQQNELLEKQQELQKAKQQKVMVMQNGRFSLTENESAVSQAEQNLSNYEDQLSYEQQIQQLEDLRDAQVETIEERIEALEEYKEYMEEYYDEQIEAMEEYYDRVQEQYELQIEALQEELDTFKEGYQKEEDLENARLAAQVLGMNERKDLYSQELENLKNYINEVNRMLESLGEAGAQVDFSYSPVTGYHQGIAEVAGVDMALETRASGDASFGKDSVALVGESPNAELLLGSNVNTIGGGKLMHLQKGTGVVNAESTQTLAGLLNGLATPQTNVANNRSTQQNFSFGTISLPNVTDADSFVNTLSHKFNNYAIQYGNTRK